MPALALLNAAHDALREATAAFPLSYTPTVVWKGYRVTAGMAYYKIGVIGLSVHVLQTPEAVRETLLHEYAHLLAVQRQGLKAANHGEAWRQAMRDLGLPPIVRHQFSVERNVPRQEVTYLCRRCGKAIVRNRRLPKRRKYVHAGCGGDLKLQAVRPVTRAADNGAERRGVE